MGEVLAAETSCVYTNRPNDTLSGGCRVACIAQERKAALRQQRYEIAEDDRDWVQRIGWRSVDDVLGWSGSGIAAVSQTSDVAEVPVGAKLGGPATVFLKRYRYDRLGQRIKQMFRGTLFGKSRARREYEFLGEMRRRQVPTVRPIAFGDRRRGAFLRASFLITEGSAGFLSLDLFALRAARAGTLTRIDERTLVERLATTIRSMHQAGVRHGGLFLRNILVHARADGAFDFALLDPDTHGRFSDSPVTSSDAAADLSEVVASAMALGRRRGLACFLKAYFQAARLNQQQRQFAARVVELARPLAPLEQRRMAVTDAIDWLRRRMDRERQGGQSVRDFDTLDGFFDAVCDRNRGGERTSSTSKSIAFSFVDSRATDAGVSRSVTLADKRLTLEAARPAKPDLVVRTDPATWLALVSGREDAHVRLRSGRLQMQGDTRLLPDLLDCIDRETMLTTTD